MEVRNFPSLAIIREIRIRHAYAFKLTLQYVTTVIPMSNKLSAYWQLEGMIIRRMLAASPTLNACSLHLRFKTTSLFDESVKKKFPIH